MEGNHLILSAAEFAPAPAPQPYTPDYSSMPDYMRPGSVPPPTEADDLRDADDLPFN